VPIASTASRHLAIRRKRAAAKSELLDDATADAFALADKRFESPERREQMATASTGAQDGVRLAGKLATFVAAIGRGVNRITGTFVAIVGLFDLGLTLGGGILAASTLFADVDAGLRVTRVLRLTASTAGRGNHGRFFAAAIFLSSLAGGFLASTTASGSSVAA
jgi:hypothetical protein